jgi:type III secretion protein Q
MQSTSENFVSHLSGKLHVVEAEDVRLSTFFFDKRFDRFLKILGIRINNNLKVRAPKEPLNSLQITFDAGLINFIICARNYPALGLVYSDGLDERLRKLAAQALLAPTLEKLGQWGLSGAYISSIGTGYSVSKDKGVQSWYTAHTDDGQELSFAIAEISESLCDVLRQKLDHIRAEKKIRPALTLRGNLILSSRVIRLNILRKLSVGDVLLTDTNTDTQKYANASIYWGAQDGRKLTGNCQFMNNSIKLTGEISVTNEIDAQSDEVSNLSSDTLGDLDIPVRFELETVAIPLSDLESIKPGYVIELTTPIDRSTIRLISAGQIVGHAELVAVGDRLGARITRMVASNELNPTS